MSVGDHPKSAMKDRGAKRGIKYFPRILLTGDTSFFAKNLEPYLWEAYPNMDLIKPNGSKFFDLTQQAHCRALFNSIENHGKIDAVIHLAAKSGGMFSNMSEQGSYYYQNINMITNILDLCAVHKVSRTLIPIGGCSYPNDIPESGVFSEDDLWNGFPNRNSFGYSGAKKTAVMMAMAYESQFSANTTVVIPTNPIGCWDNVSEQDSHVPMALIGRFIEAKEFGYSNVNVYGDPNVERDFLYIDDIVSLFPIIINKFNGVGPLNISSGVGTTIGELAETIRKVVGFEGKIINDTSKPSGQKRKILDNTKLRTFLAEENYEWNITPLETAIERTVKWYYERVWNLSTPKR